ncbi:MAG TPA: hypothetical protein VES02_04985 [Dermatophilaceae bacterium]|nr:hypothetical protein [Dermatophilaceae bacterium]
MVCRAFDYRADRPIFEDPIPVSTTAVVIVEGMFLHRDELLDTWDMSVFLDVPFAISVRRLAERDDTSPTPTTHRCTGTSRVSGSTSPPAHHTNERRTSSPTTDRPIPRSAH